MPSPLPHPRLHALLLFAFLAFAGTVSTRPALAQVAVLTQNNENARTGANTAETTLTPAAVSSGHFGKLFTLPLDANVNGQVLYFPGITINGAVHNVIYAYTSNNSNGSRCGLWAYDADNPNQTAALWHTAFPLSAQYTTATPVIDPATGTIYVLTKSAGPFNGSGDTDVDDGPTFLHAIDITTGKERANSPIRVQATTAGTGDGAFTNGQGQSVVAFDGPATKVKNGGATFHANDRAGLLLLNGVVYAAFAFNSDANPYHGWILGYQYTGNQFVQKYVFCTTPNGSEATDPNGGDGGVWMAGKGLTADASGNIYCAVGNGTFDANAGGVDYGMCYLKLSPSLAVEDWYAPYDAHALSIADQDVGNTGLVGIPGTTRLFGGATKFGAGFLLDSTNLGRFPSDAQHETAVQRLNSLSNPASVGQNPIAWDTGSQAIKYVYLWTRGNELEQFQYDPSTGKFGAATSSSFPPSVYRETTGRNAGGSLAISASGVSGGILWGVGYDNNLYAFDATDVSKPLLWSGSVGSVGHFQFPTVANGKVYVPTGSATIAVFGLSPAPAPELPVFRLYAPVSNDHLYTVNGAEESFATGLGYGFEGVIGYAPAAGTPGSAPVYRLYNPPTGEHFYTANAAERASVLANLGYRDEGVAFGVLTTAGTGLLPLYRLYEPFVGRHFYTTNQAEQSSLIGGGYWDDEGILGYLNAP